jgi:hypothetical protein
VPARDGGLRPALATIMERIESLLR